jgi:abhydrolase domain-containing protein 12
LEPPSTFGPFRPCHTNSTADVYRPLRLVTPDGFSLGAWHIASMAVSSEKTSFSESSPFLLYFHGNAGTRAFKTRLETYKTLLEAFPKSQLLSIDYRGFGDSEGTPSEEGLLIDAMTAWSYVTGTLRGDAIGWLDQDVLIFLLVSPKNIIIIGHSLGTGVASLLTRRLERSQNISPKGLISICGFKSIPAAASTYPWMKLVLPLPVFCHHNPESLFSSIMTERFDTKTAMVVRAKN